MKGQKGEVGGGGGRKRENRDKGKGRRGKTGEREREKREDEKKTPLGIESVTLCRVDRSMLLLLCSPC